LYSSYFAVWFVTALLWLNKTFISLDFRAFDTFKFEVHRTVIW
jgi:hypothetical protein